MKTDPAKKETDIIEVLEAYISQHEPRKWAKLASTVNYRRLVLSLLKEILVELRKLNQSQNVSPEPS